jgi:anaerobic selenocysteine-containing dehydrogenase
MSRSVPVVDGVVPGACPHDCPDSCAWRVTVQDGRAVKLSGNPDHPVTRGGLCAKVNHYLDRVYGPERLTQPLRRIGPKGEGRFEPIGWDEAIAEIAGRLGGIIERHGGEAILPFSYLGSLGMVQTQSLDRRFFARIGASRLERAVCGAAGWAGLLATIGTDTGMLPEDIVHSRFIIIWGANPIVTNLHHWPLVREAKARGATVVVIDPARTRTAAAADWHIQPIPGTDAALALGMMHVIVRDGLHDGEYVERHTLGFDALRERLAEYPPDRAAAITGIPAAEIERLARAYATTAPAAIRTLVGMEHRANGAGIYRAVACLPALIGAWKHLGGGLLHMTASLASSALDGAALTMPGLEHPGLRSFNMVQLGRALTDETLDPPVAALVVYGSNPAVTMPNQALVRRGLAREDLFTVVHEQVMTDTAKFADYVLPATTQLEHLDLISSWGQTCLALNLPAIAPVGEARSTTQLFRDLAAAMDMTEPWLHESDEALARAALASGHPYLEGITFERLREDGWAPLALPRPWLPFAEGGFPTPSGRTEFRSPALDAAGLDPLPGYVPAPTDAAWPLSLLTPKSEVHFLNSSYAGLSWHRKAAGEPRLDLHAEDAAPRGIVDGDMVRVLNDRGELRLRVRVEDRVRPGTAAMPFGWEADGEGPGPLANLLTADGLSDLGGGGDFSDTRVEVLPVRRM